MTWQDFHWSTIEQRTEAELAQRVAHLQGVALGGGDDAEADSRPMSVHWELMLVRLRLHEVRAGKLEMVAELTEAETETTGDTA